MKEEEFREMMPDHEVYACLEIIESALGSDDKVALNIACEMVTFFAAFWKWNTYHDTGVKKPVPEYVSALITLLEPTGLFKNRVQQ